MSVFYQDGSVSILYGDATQEIKSLPDESVQTCVTSPPYWGLRDYGVDGQLGLEKTPEEYVSKMVEVFREVKRVIKADGTLWLNLGDSYAGSMKGANGDGTWQDRSNFKQGTNKGALNIPPQKANAIGLKNKDLVGIPWRVAFALQADGWYLRSDIIWHKPNPMPESVTDRPTKAHEYLFLLSKSERYYYNHEAIKEPAIYADDNRKPYAPGQVDARGNGHDRGGGKQRGHGRRHAGFNERWDSMSKAEQCSGMRNKRSVWTVATQAYKEAHFATFPPKLIWPCILAGSRSGDVVLDPFHGSGTTAMVSKQLGRRYVGCELNREYIEMSLKRLPQEVLPI